MKKITLGILFVSVCMLTSCAAPKTSDNAKSSSNYSTSITTEKESNSTTEESLATTEESNIVDLPPEINLADSKYSVYDKETKEFGEEQQGYTELPADWVTFKEVNGVPDTTIQYSNSIGSQVINMHNFTALGAIETVMGSTLQYHQMIAANKDDVKIGTLTFNGHNAFQLYTETADGRFLVDHIFTTDDNKILDISLEGTLAEKDEVISILKLIDKTYHN